MWTSSHLFALLLLFSSSCSAFLTYSGNLSAPITPNGWNYRTITVSDIDKYNYLSQDPSGDILTGSFFSEILAMPFGFVSHFAAGSDVLDIDAGDFRNLNVTSALSYIGVGGLRLDEIDPSGNIVVSRNLTWTPIATYTITETSDNTPNLRKFQFAIKGNIIPGWAMDVTFVLSQVAGVLDNAVPVVPSALTVVFSVNTWSYANASNSLVLVLIVGSGPSSVSSSQKGLLVSNDNQVYLALNSSVKHSAGVSAVDISAFSPFDGRIDTPYFYSQLATRYGADATIKQASVSFPAGASGIVYSCTFGSGKPVKDGDWGYTTPTLAPTTPPTSSSHSSFAHITSYLFFCVSLVLYLAY